MHEAHVYVIDLKPRKLDGNPRWGLIWQWYEDGKARQKRVPLDQYLALGFPPSLSKADAQARAEQINAQQKLKQREAARAKVTERIQHENTVLDAYLNPQDVADFEQNVLFARNKDASRRNKIDVHWRAVKRALTVLQIDVSDWADEPNPGRFYDYFKSQTYSNGYCQKLLPILNKWGRFIAKKYRKPFLPLPYPRGEEFHAIADNYFNIHTRSTDSDPLTPERLESARSKLDSELFNWVYLSVWFGLRPLEVDLLKKPSSRRTWFVEREPDGVQVLWIYQSKLTRIPFEQRIKPIPCRYKEQVAGLELISSQKFQRPLAKTLKRVFTPHTTCYAGRKGFTDLMLSKGENLEDISMWLGHQSIDRTWRSYKDRKRVRYKNSA